MTKALLDLAVSASSGASSLSQFPAKSASAYTLNDSSFGLNIIPLSRVPARYLHNHSTALPCDCLGSAAKRAA